MDTGIRCGDWVMATPGRTQNAGTVMQVFRQDAPSGALIYTPGQRNLYLSEKKLRLEVGFSVARILPSPFITYPPARGTHP